MTCRRVFRRDDDGQTTMCSLAAPDTHTRRTRHRVITGMARAAHATRRFLFLFDTIVMIAFIVTFVNFSLLQGFQSYRRFIEVILPIFIDL